MAADQVPGRQASAGNCLFSLGGVETVAVVWPGDGRGAARIKFFASRCTPPLDDETLFFPVCLWLAPTFSSLPGA